MPLNGQVDLFKEILHELIRRLQHTAAAHLHPIALRARISTSVYDLKHKWFEDFEAIGPWLEAVLPMFLLPPPIAFIVID